MSFNFVVSCSRPLSVFMTGVTACDPAGLHHTKFFFDGFLRSVIFYRCFEVVGAVYSPPPPPASRVKSLTHVSYRQLEVFDRWSTSMVCGWPWNSLGWVTSTNLEQPCSKISVSKVPLDLKCKARSPRASGMQTGWTYSQSKQRNERHWSTTRKVWRFSVVK